MTILIACGGGYVQGKEIVMLQLARELKERGHNVHFLVSIWTNGDLITRLTAAGITFTRLPLGFISKRLQPQAFFMTLHQLLRLPELWFRFVRVRSALQPDLIIHTTSHHVLLLLPLLDARRTIFHVHDATPMTRINRVVLALVSRRIARFVAVSDFVRRRLIGMGVPDHQVVRIYNATDLTHQETEKASVADKAAGLTRVGIVGQVRALKGHEDILEAARILHGRGITFRLLVFGEGKPEYLRHLQQRAREYGLDRVVEWRGYERDRGKIYPTLDIVVVPSLFEETFGLSALEPAVWSLPVVCTRIGGLPEVVEDGVTGLLVEPGRPHQLAQRLEVLITDPELRRRLGTNARERALRQFSPKAMTAAFEELLNAHTRARHDPGLIRGKLA